MPSGCRQTPPPPPPRLSEPRVGFQPPAKTGGSCGQSERGIPRLLPRPVSVAANGRAGVGKREGAGRPRRRVLALTKVTPALNYPQTLQTWAKLCSPVQESCGEDNKAPHPTSPTSYARPPPLQTSTRLVIFFSRWRLLTMQKSHVTSLLLSLLCVGLTGKLK